MPRKKKHYFGKNKLRGRFGKVGGKWIVPRFVRETVYKKALAEFVNSIIDSLNQLSSQGEAYVKLPDEDCLFWERKTMQSRDSVRVSVLRERNSEHSALRMTFEDPHGKEV